MKPKVTKSNQVMVAPESRLVRFAPGSVLRGGESAMSAACSALREELVTTLATARSALPLSTLRRRITATRHDSRIGAELRRLEQDGIARFTPDGGWELVSLEDERRVEA
jgi:hypothetical protein